MASLSAFGAFLKARKTRRATPNLTGKDGLLAGTALMFSTRFLLMAIGSALGGFAAAYFGYQIAFIINAASFAISAFSVWLIPEEATREQVRRSEIDETVLTAPLTPAGGFMQTELLASPKRASFLPN